MWILIVEDEVLLSETLRQGLEEENHKVTVTADGIEAIHAAETLDFDAIVLDLMIPRLNGIGVLKRLRAGGRKTPVVILTALAANQNGVGGLDAGADDYLTNPFSFEVLLARLRAVSRRSSGTAGAKLHVADLELDPASKKVVRAGVELTITATEYRLL